MQGMNKNAVLVEERVRSLWQVAEHGKPSNLTCAKMNDLADIWLEKKSAQVKQSTYANYYYHVYHHIMPILGECPLSALNAELIISFISFMERKLSVNSIKVILTTLKMILKYGERQKMVDKSLIEYCKIHYHRKEAKMLSQDDSLRMKEYLLKKKDIFSIGILLCRSTGIRVGELCGLQWGDINFRNNTFFIRRTVSRITNPNKEEGQPKTILYIRSPKSYTSIREIPIPHYLIPILWGVRKQDNCYVLTGTENCTEPRNVQKRFKTILRRCEMQNCNFHAMRHGFASACIQNGNDCKTVSTLLGHSSAKITMDIYIHTSLHQKENCINSLT